MWTLMMSADSSALRTWPAAEFHTHRHAANTINFGRLLMELKPEAAERCPVFHDIENRRCDP